MLVNSLLYGLFLWPPLHVRDRHEDCESYRSPWPARPLHEYF